MLEPIPEEPEEIKSQRGLDNNIKVKEDYVLYLQNDEALEEEDDVGDTEYGQVNFIKKRKK